MSKHKYLFEKVSKYGGYIEVYLKSSYSKQVLLFKDETLVFSFEDTYNMFHPIKPLTLSQDKLLILWDTYRIRALYAETVSDCFCKKYIQIQNAIEKKEVFNIQVDLHGDGCIFLGDYDVTEGFLMIEFIEDLFLDIDGDPHPIIMMHYLNQKNLPYVANFDIDGYEDSDELLKHLNQKTMPDFTNERYF